MNGVFDLDSMLRSGNSDNMIKQIPVEMCIPYHNHSFRLYEGERLDDMVESIIKNGVLNPVIVQPLPDGKYEILIGHNRWNASVIAEKKTVPVIIKTGLSEDEAEMYVIESNLMQRGFENLRISEQAAVIAMRHEKMFSENKRNEILAQLKELDENASWDTSKQIGKEYSMSKNSVARLLRINKLSENLKKSVDEGIIAIRTGVELSYLDIKTQEYISELLISYNIDWRKAAMIRSCADTNGYSPLNRIIEILDGKHKPEKLKMYKIRSERISRFFTEESGSEEIEETIEKALEMYFSDKDKGEIQ